AHPGDVGEGKPLAGSPGEDSLATHGRRRCRSACPVSYTQEGRADHSAARIGPRAVHSPRLTCRSMLCLPGFPLPASRCRGAAGRSGPVAEGNRSYKESSMGWTPVRTKLVLLVGLSLLASAAPPGAAPNNPPVPDPQQAAEDAALRQLTDELEKVVALLAQAK